MTYKRTFMKALSDSMNLWLWTTALLTLVCTPVFAQETPDVTGANEVPALDLRISPLTNDAVHALNAIREDPAPEAIIKDRHYLTSNEANQHYFYDPIRELGGMYVGVGAEQNYLFAGWSRPEILFLVDFDIWVVRLHKVYDVMFRHADNPDAFVELWKTENRKQVNLWIKEAIPDAAEAKKVAYVHKVAHKKVGRRLRALRREYRKKKIPMFLTLQEEYLHLKTLFHLGRVRMVRGDLTEDKTMSDIADFGRRFCIPMRLVYLSNVEYYVKYRNGHWRENLIEQPYDDRSIILHTDPRSELEYKYIVQKAENYRDWLNCHCVSGLRKMLKHGKRQKEREHIIVEKFPSDVKDLVKKMKKKPPPPLRQWETAGCHALNALEVR